jgi:hypothetical protein
MREAPSRDSSSPGTPTWVKVFAIVAGIVVVLFVVLLLAGRHGPSRHGTSLGPVTQVTAGESETMSAQV